MFMRWWTPAPKSADCRSISQTVCTARPAISWILIKSLTGFLRRVEADQTIEIC